MKRHGYTLIELVLVIVLLLLLASGTIIGYNFYINKSKDSGVDINLKTINMTIDYIQDTKNRLPNIKEVKEDMGEHAYKFYLTDAIISEVDGETYITIRAETTQLSEYKIPYALNVIALYGGEFGPRTQGDTIDIETHREELIGYNPESITMLVLDNTPSGVPEIYWLN